MDEYSITKLNIYEAYESGYITESEKYDLLEILEAEEDHYDHMQKKKSYAKYFDKDEKDLPNKKYKNEKSAKRADQIYKYKEGDVIHKSGFKEKQTWNLNRKAYENNKPKEIDSKLTRMIGDNIGKDDETSKKRVDYARKKLLQRLGEDPKNTEIFVKNQKGDTPDKDRIRIDAYKSGKSHDLSKLLSKDDDGNEYVLVHKTDKDKLRKLKGHDTSTRYVNNTGETSEGQLHPEKRTYYTVKKKSDAYDKHEYLGGYGDRACTHKYVLKDKKVKKFNYDPEQSGNYAQMRYGPKGKGSDESYQVYITGDEQKVKQTK